jgi:hypothetical protein
MAKKDLKPTVIPTVEPVEPVAAVAPVAPVALVSFDMWWAMVQKNMPEQHRKEVVLADFRARGLRAHEPMSAFNKALALYGVKLK